MPTALMQSANPERAKMSGAIAVQADFTDAIMKGCRLVRANLRQARLSGANLENADLSGCNLTGADLNGAILVGCRLDLAVTQGADFSETLTEQETGRSPGAVPVEELLELHAKWVETDGREGKPADLSNMDLRGVMTLGRSILDKSAG